MFFLLCHLLNEHGQMHTVLCPCSISFCSCQMREGLSWGNSRKSSASWDILERKKDSLQSGNHSLSFIICIRIRLESSGLQMRKCNKLLYNICTQWTDSRKKSDECAYLILLVISWELLFFVVFVFVCCLRAIKVTFSLVETLQHGYDY